MSKNPEIENLAVFCDFENVAIGVRDAHLPPFDVRKILERLLLKGNIVVKKAYCDDFIFYESLLRKGKGRRRSPPTNGAEGRGGHPESAGVESEVSEQTAPGRTFPPEGDPRQEALDMMMETIEALAEERGAEDKMWGSMVKQALKRRHPGFAESSYGFRSFNRLLEEAATRGLVELEPDQRSGGYIILSVQQID